MTIPIWSVLLNMLIETTFRINTERSSFFCFLSSSLDQPIRSESVTRPHDDNDFGNLSETPADDATLSIHNPFTADLRFSRAGPSNTVARAGGISVAAMRLLPPVVGEIRPRV